LEGEPFLDDSDIASAKVVPAGPEGLAGTNRVQVWFTDAGSRAISAATSDQAGQQIAIEVNGQIVAAPKVRGTVSRTAYISGDFTPEQAEALAAGLNQR
jgi:preprotein translocase subunit SecD